MEVNNDEYVAALDLGTNTFNLAIAKSKAPFRIVLRKERGVFLGKGGLAKQIILPSAIKRAQDVLTKYSAILSEYSLVKVRCVATEAIRNAQNSKEVLKHLEINVPFTVETIPGEHEAELVYKGVKSTGILDDNNVLIVDIGGGSVEFIIANKSNIHWKKSFKIGISRALESYPLSNPPTKDELLNHTNYFRDNLIELKENLEKYDFKTLIGTAGSFDSWRKIISPEKSGPTCSLDKEILLNTIKTINSLSLQKRKKIEGMEEMRIETIAPAGVLLSYLLDSFTFEYIYQCSFSLSEGVLWEMIYN